jgi:WhiB family redox-sensing transcriptional regulator
MIAPLAPEIIDLTERSTDEAEPEILTSQDTWWAHARCNDGSGRLAGMFFSEELQDIARAKNICATCPALIPCLEGALERREPWGVWGGQLFLNGKILATKRRRGRRLAATASHPPAIPAAPRRG